jgi:hypothetical protein
MHIVHRLRLMALSRGGNASAGGGGGGGGAFAVTGTLPAAQWGVPYTASLGISGGTAPYSVSGLPAYGPGATTDANSADFSGTPL